MVAPASSQHFRVVSSYCSSHFRGFESLFNIQCCLAEKRRTLDAPTSQGTASSAHLLPAFVCLFVRCSLAIGFIADANLADPLDELTRSFVVRSQVSHKPVFMQILSRFVSLRECRSCQSRGFCRQHESHRRSESCNQLRSAFFEEE